jgi:branched-chain amino acid transport system permease protein
MVAFGGRGTIAGPIIGSAILVPIPFLLQALYQIKDIFYGLLIILVTVAMPAGVYGTLLIWWRARQRKVAAGPVAIKRVPAE